MMNRLQQANKRISYALRDKVHAMPSQCCGWCGEDTDYLIFMDRQLVCERCARDEEIRSQPQQMLGALLLWCLLIVVGSFVLWIFQ